MTITCGCGNVLHVGEHLAGKQVGCPSCGAAHRVPDAGATESKEEEAVTAEKPMPVRRDDAWRPSPGVEPKRSATGHGQGRTAGRSRIGQRLGGLFILAVGGGFTAWSWYTALTEGYYYHNAAALFPAFTVIGLALLLFPIDRDRLRAEHGVDRPQSLAHYPTAWKVLLVVALIAGLANWLAITLL